MVAMNHAAVDRAVSELNKIEVPMQWITAYDNATRDAIEAADQKFARTKSGRQVDQSHERAHFAASKITKSDTFLSYGSGVPTPHEPLDHTSGIAMPVMSDLVVHQHQLKFHFDYLDFMYITVFKMKISRYILL